MRFAIDLKANMIELARYQGGSEHTCRGRCRSLPLSSWERLCTGEHSPQSLDLHVEKRQETKLRDACIYQSACTSRQQAYLQRDPIKNTSKTNRE
jgi:hypothetical protein